MGSTAPQRWRGFPGPGRDTNTTEINGQTPRDFLGAVIWPLLREDSAGPWIIPRTPSHKIPGRDRTGLQAGGLEGRAFHRRLGK